MDLTYIVLQIIIAVLAALISTYIIYVIVKIFVRKTPSAIVTNPRAQFVNKGKNNTFIDNSFDNVDVLDEGENTLAKGNRFK